MKRTVTAITVLFLLAATFCLTAAAQEKKEEAKGPLTGAWTCVGKAPDRPDLQFQLNMEQIGEEVKGTGSNAAGNAPLKGTFTDGKFKVAVEGGQAIYQFEGKLEGDKISGTFAIAAAGIQGTFEGVRKKGPLTGAWKLTLKGPDRPDSEAQLDLDQDGEIVKGTGSNAGGSAPLKGTCGSDGNFKLVVAAGGGNWDVEGKLEGEKITGTWVFVPAGLKGAFEGVRKQ